MNERICKNCKVIIHKDDMAARRKIIFKRTATYCPYCIRMILTEKMERGLSNPDTETIERHVEEILEEFYDEKLLSEHKTRGEAIRI